MPCITARYSVTHVAFLNSFLLHSLPAGTSPHAPVGIHVVPSSTWANVSWEVGYDGGFQQTFSVWYGHVWVIPACFASCFFFFQYFHCCFWKCLFQGCVQNSWNSEKKEMENTWRYCEWVFISNLGISAETNIKTIATQLNMTQRLRLLLCCFFTGEQAWLKMFSF